MPARQGAFFGRRKGRPLREQQRELFAALLPELQLDLSRPAPRDLRGLFAARPASPTRRDLFAARLPPQASLSNPGVLFTAPAALAGTVENVRLEIGFGGGEHLLHEAARRPASGFIGIEPFVNGMAKMLAALAAAPQKAANIRLYHNDALQILNWLPANSLAGIDIFYPDPWPKKKHWKRRFINAGTLEHFARLLQSGGILRFASDIDSYINQVLQLMRDHKAFSWAAETAKDWQIPYNAWPGTRYEAKARQAGRKPAYLTFIRR
ncbi:tRNA (guanine(46)-N(7))-methyltransferase TrmB [Candidatus Tokpelaia sp.]|uniref:tRNA (guanine(46)-N(7))-methyltransferase TrmB n=1 Tax=Candidatus Tokpelaia sp. TaxID=2233777 RepID=UPI00123BE412|nr:tRNA (guanine(46)-N(7))-methyltransferase TrmB [Candidatus Tokpelaia sp.]KAA6405462.1 tRNA (guanosine(46)-N7)-methyltransferase TrmB [Candidatus Tokpelaia sp.]